MSNLCQRTFKGFHLINGASYYQSSHEIYLVIYIHVYTFHLTSRQLTLGDIEMSNQYH